MSELSFDLADYDFVLPPALIAQQPIEPRHASRMLLLPRGNAQLSDAHVSDLPNLLPKNALLVVNDTQVVRARLIGRKSTGGAVELLLTRPFSQDSANLRAQSVIFKTSKGLKIGQVIDFGQQMSAEVVALGAAGTATIDLHGAADLAQLLDTVGHVPLPPYIRGGIDQPDLDGPRYQCTFAQKQGAVAAPTAGLHLSVELLAQLAEKAIERAAITLHVGPGTFLPVRHEDLRLHQVLPERYELTGQTADQLNRARRDKRPIIAVGTTTTRTLETIAQQQGTGDWQAQKAEANLTILPGQRFMAIAGLMTNFHLPRSSLLVLVSAFAGRDRVLQAYRHAIENGYRFYSYGDAMLILP